MISGPSTDPETIPHFAQAVDHFLKNLSSDKDPANQTINAINYGRLVTRLGTAEQARAVAGAGREAAAKMTDAIRREAYLNLLAGIQADSGDAAGAITQVSKLTDPMARADGYVQLAARFGKQKENAQIYQQCIALARQALESVKDPLASSGLLVRIVDVQVAAGDGTGTRETTSHITEPWQAAGAHLSLSHLPGLAPDARARELTAAEDSAIKLPDNRMADTMVEIAGERSRAGDAEGARRTLERAETTAEALQRDLRVHGSRWRLAWGRLGDKAGEVRLLKRAGPASRDLMMQALGRPTTCWR